jgi:single-stranded DNA-binding protein
MSGIEGAFFGALGRDAETKTSKAGKPYLRLNLRTGDGDSAQWINVTCFDQQAIKAVDKLVKGARIYCEGSIKLDEWIASDGTKKHGLSCLSWHCRLSQIGRNRPKRSENTIGAKSQPAGDGADLNDEIPF